MFPTKVRPGPSRHMWESAYLTFAQPKTSSVSSIPFPNIGSPRRKNCRIHGSRASQLRRNLTRAACARTLIPGLAGITWSTWGALLQVLKSNGANNNKKDQLALSSDDDDAIAGADAGHLCGTRRQNRTPRNSNSTCRFHRQKIAPLGPGWLDPWRRGLREERRR